MRGKENERKRKKGRLEKRMTPKPMRNTMRVAAESQCHTICKSWRRECEVQGDIPLCRPITFSSNHLIFWLVLEKKKKTDIPDEIFSLVNIINESNTVSNPLLENCVIQTKHMSGLVLALTPRVCNLSWNEWYDFKNLKSFKML